MSQHLIPILKATRRNIELPEHWGKGGCFSRPATQMCLGEAVAGACGLPVKTGWGNIDSLDPRLVAYGDTCAELADDPSGVVNFNDNKATTHADVLVKIDETIARLGVEGMHA